MIRPIPFRALDSKGNIYEAVAESFINSSFGFGRVESDIPEQPSNMIELIDLRHRGYIIETSKEGLCPV